MSAFSFGGPLHASPRVAFFAWPSLQGNMPELTGIAKAAFTIILLLKSQPGEFLPQIGIRKLENSPKVENQIRSTKASKVLDKQSLLTTYELGDMTWIPSSTESRKKSNLPPAVNS